MASQNETPISETTSKNHQEPKLNEITLSENEKTTAVETKEDQIITLVSSDGKEFKIASSAASLSGLIKNMIEDDCASSAIPLPAIDASTLAKIVAYLEGMSDLQSKTWVDRMKFEDEFVEREEMNDLFDLILAADYLIIKDLMIIVGSQIDVLMMKKGFTWEEQESIRHEYRRLWEIVDPGMDDETTAYRVIY